MIIFLRTLDMTDINFSEIETNSFEALTSWNFEIDKESFEACIYLVMKEKLIEKIISLNYGSLSDEIINWNNVGGVSHVRRFLAPLINENIALDLS